MHYLESKDIHDIMRRDIILIIVRRKLPTANAATNVDRFLILCPWQADLIICDHVIISMVIRGRVIYKPARHSPQSQSRITDEIKFFFFTILRNPRIPTIFQTFIIINPFHFLQIPILKPNTLNFLPRQLSWTIRNLKSPLRTPMNQMRHRRQIVLQIFILPHLLHNLRSSHIPHLPNQFVDMPILPEHFHRRSQNDKFSSIVNGHSRPVNGFVPQPRRMILLVEIHHHFLGRFLQQIEIDL
mmetsp:Transcript_15593/g.31662  ORF Transcript_15593/g.31662 Transcript_15593/m.31662 type:complete len:242 (-) Transcript_15593:1028-1753(-)